MAAAPPKNTGLYANEEGKIVVHDLPFPEPQEGELLIKVLYSGVNPSDVRTLEFFGLKNYALGGEFCGEVLDSPTLTTTPYKAGDRVAGLVVGGIGRHWRFATHKEYLTAHADWVFKVPDHMPPQAAASLSVVVQTASNTLYNHFHLPLPPSVAKGTHDEGVAAPEGTLVVWGGATGVGMAAIQLARASRVSSIIAIASAQRHEFLKTLGATQCFNYRDPDVVKNVKSALQGTKGTIWGFDALGTIEKPVSQEILKSAIPPHDNIRLATVLLVPHEGFEPVVGNRQFDLDLDLPDGKKLFWPKDEAATKRHWKGLRWVIDNYGGEYKPTPIRVFNGPSEDAVKELNNVGNMNNFGKLVFKLPLC